MAPRLARPLVFTNGVFDLLHVGHISYLEAASAHGSCLVVALNSDHSAGRLGKAGDRPLHALNDRARVVAALGCVSWVTWFDEDTPAALLAALRPEVYVKGGDYSLDTLPEAPLVQSWGGRVAIAPYLSGHSTTGLMQQLGHLPP
nr:adenylyltransferase/cytidyltransferase family protein [Roseateles sp. SL47]